MCRTRLYNGESQLCSQCLSDLPTTIIDPDISKSFYERENYLFPSHIYALISYTPQSEWSMLIKQIKYHNKRKLAVLLGQILAHQIDPNLWDIIIPVPLHPKKKRERGYNQSLYIAIGLSQQLEIPIDESSVRRVRNNISQTKLSRGDRLNSSKNLFEVIHPELLKEKRVLIVDDVLTTGATMLEFAQTIANYTHKPFGFASIAYSHRD